MQLFTSGLIILRDKKLLLAYSRNKQCFYLPGGKIAAGETAERALCREIEEELNLIIEEEDLSFYTHITAPAFGETDGTIMEQDCFLIDIKAEPNAGAEIDALQFFSLEEYLNADQVAPGVVMLMKKLRADGLIY